MFITWFYSNQLASGCIDHYVWYYHSKFWQTFYIFCLLPLHIQTYSIWTWRINTSGGAPALTTYFCGSSWCASFRFCTTVLFWIRFVRCFGKLKATQFNWSFQSSGAPGIQCVLCGILKVLGRPCSMWYFKGIRQTIEAPCILKKVYLWNVFTGLSFVKVWKRNN